MDLLIVSEDPEFINDVQEFARKRGSRAFACLGPANGPCPLETEGHCPLADRADVAIVDAPSGEFRHLSDVVPAGRYAGHLREACPHSLVVLESPDFRAGPAGGGAHVSNRKEALRLLRDFVPKAPSPPRDELPDDSTRRKSRSGNRNRP